MSDYPFQLINYAGTVEEKHALLRQRAASARESSFEADAKVFVPGAQLETAIDTAIAVGDPLLITGEPGTGKTQTAYYVAHKLGLEPVISFQVKSDSVARDLLYHFDTVRYFHEANLRKNGDELDKNKYIEERPLWEAFKRSAETGLPCILLIDEIDKAPRDFPNDLLMELDRMEFKILETGTLVKAPKGLRPIVFITSNSERRLPEPFLRRCVYHHIRFDDDIVRRAVEARKSEFAKLSPEFLQMAIERFLALREESLRKLPATSELLVWLRVLALAVGTYPERLEGDLSKLPYIGTLLKDHQDIEDIRQKM